MNQQGQTQGHKAKLNRFKGLQDSLIPIKYDTNQNHTNIQELNKEL